MPADRKRDPDHSDDDVAVKREPQLERLRDEVRIAQDNISLSSQSAVLNALDDLAEALDDAILNIEGPTSAEVKDQREREAELKKPQ